MSPSDRIFKLLGKVQHYAWGGRDFLPSLLNTPNADGKPFAEYWMGDHGNTPAEILLKEGGKVRLDHFIRENKNEALGKEVAERFGRLPFLFKVLDVKAMLSIQVHPTKEEAKKGYDRENTAGIPLNAPERNYKDDNHKPEIMVALSDFWLLHGFKDAAQLEKLLSEYPAFHSLLPDFKQFGIKELYARLMQLPQQEIDQLLQPLAKDILLQNSEGKLSKKDPSFWAVRAIEQYSGGDLTGLDRGIFAIYFLNLVFLRPGEAIFQDAGIPHAYLEGRNMELMANSDNVLRGGLTPKHINVEELIKHTSFKGITPEIISPTAPGTEPEQVYPSPAPDFTISRLSLEAKKVYSAQSYSAEILFVTEGAVQICVEQSLMLHRGEAAFIMANTRYELHGQPSGVCFKASVPAFSV